jgi:hypothetical protein
LETRESPRGLIVNISQVLFDTYQYAETSRNERSSSKVSEIVLAHPGFDAGGRRLHRKLKKAFRIANRQLKSAPKSI